MGQLIFMKHIYSVWRHWLVNGLLVVMSMSKVSAQAPAWQTAITPSQSNAANASLIIATATDASGNVYVAGSFIGTVSFGSTSLTSPGGSDAFVAKWNPASGTFAWAHRMGGSNYDVAKAVVVAGTSVYVAGAFSGTAASFGTQSLASAGDTDAFVAKLTDAGSTSSFVWTQRVGGIYDEQASALAISSSGLYVAGSFSSSTVSFGPSTLNNSGGDDAFVAKLTDAGATSAFAWAQQAGGTGIDGAYALAAHGSDLYLAGYYNSASASFGNTVLSTSGMFSYNAFVARLTDQGTSGSFVWAQQGGGTGRTEAHTIAVSGANVYVAGYFSGLATFGGISVTSAGNYDAFVAKLTNTGTYAWIQRAGGIDDDEAFGLAVTGSAVYLAGAFNSPAISFGTSSLANSGSGTADAFLAKLTDAGTAGNFAWAQRAGGSDDDYAGAVVVRGQQVYVAGSATPPASFGNLTIANPSGSPERIGFLASLSDPTLTATAPAKGSLSFSLAPNPVRAAATVTLPAVPGAATATLTLLDALGREVRTETVPVPAGGLVHELRLAGMPAGLYALRMEAGTEAATMRLVVE
jgi:hypothetical protein